MRHLKPERIICRLKVYFICKKGDVVMEFKKENIKDCINSLENGYTGARAMDDIEAMERFQTLFTF